MPRFRFASTLVVALSCACPALAGTASRLPKPSSAQLSDASLLSYVWQEDGAFYVRLVGRRADPTSLAVNVCVGKVAELWSITGPKDAVKTSDDDRCAQAAVTLAKDQHVLFGFKGTGKSLSLFGTAGGRALVGGQVFMTIASRQPVNGIFSVELEP